MEVFMSAFNVVRFRVKPGMEDKFIQVHKELARNFSGFHVGHLIQTGNRGFCFIGEWDDMDSIASNRSKMIANLDTFREMLEDLGNGLGVTDPISGESVLDFYATGKTTTSRAEQELQH
jgi:hypothetical protein